VSLKDDQSPKTWYDGLPEHWKQWIDDYVKIHPNPDREEGLVASDFSGTVIVDFEDTSQVVFKHAFCVFAADRNELAVFTEHCGYYVFSLGPEDSFSYWKRSPSIIIGESEEKP
jgi:hypothetical protein